MQPDNAINPILQADGLSFCHATPSATRLFDGLTVFLYPGITLLCGEESSGKTTLLQLLAGTLPTTGRLLINGVSLAENKLAYQRQVAWLDPRDAALDTHVARQIFADLPNRYPEFDQGLLQAHIDGLSLAPHLDKTLFMMSTGTRRKVLLAAVLAAEAPVTLMDQPFMALDRPSIDYLLGVLAAASRHPGRAWVVADYEAPADVTLAGIIELKPALQQSVSALI